MSLTEATRLVQILRSDPSSALAAAIDGWDHPISRTEAILMDLWDLEYAKSGAKDRTRYPRPFPKQGITQRLDPRTENPSGVAGSAGGRSRDEVVEILRQHGHDPADIPA